MDLGELNRPWGAWREEHEHQGTPKRERTTGRIELNLTASELATLKRMAGHEGYVPTKLVVVAEPVEVVTVTVAAPELAENPI